jgi:transcriptional regulator with XRE-family HTH domain
MRKSTFTHEYLTMRRLLRGYRRRGKLTQAELARRVDETQSYVSKVERGERRLDLVQLKFFCAALGITLRDFVNSFEEQLSNRYGESNFEKKTRPRPSGRRK